ncbi:hypothetical protein WDW37_20700 [Bdellovibrionota bacterium FG-1]
MQIRRNSHGFRPVFSRIFLGLRKIAEECGSRPSFFEVILAAEIARRS